MLINYWMNFHNKEVRLTRGQYRILELIALESKKLNAAPCAFMWRDIQKHYECVG